MKLPLQIILEMRFESTPDGRTWTQTTFAYDFWQRYLDVFDEVVVFARVKKIASAGESAKRADGENVRYVHIPHYLGPGPFLSKFIKIRQSLRNGLSARSAVLFRIPSILAEVTERNRKNRHSPFGVEVVGDPYDVFAPQVINHPLRPILRWIFSKHVRRFCQDAGAVAYVNETILKRRYPPSASAFATSYSSVDLPEEAFRSTKPEIIEKKTYKIVFVGSLAQEYKGADIIIDAVGNCSNAGFSIELKIVGDGYYKSHLAHRVRERGLDERVTFLGQLPAGDAVRRAIDDGDLFVLPARTEGLPRVVIEAMARSKPCISTTVGGIPELLLPEYLVPPNNPEALAGKIMEVLSDPNRMEAMGARNYTKARAFRKELLDERRRVFYTHLRSITERWLRENNAQ